MLFNFKKQPLVAADISDYSIEILQLNSKREVLAYNRAVLEENIVQDNKIIDEEKFISIFQKLLIEAKPNSLDPKQKNIKIAVSLPEPKTYIHAFEIDAKLEKEDFEKALLDKAKEVIPFNLEDLYWDYFVLDSNPEKKNILYISAPQNIINDYSKVFSKIGADLVAVEPESIAVGRALFSAPAYFKSLSQSASLDYSMILDIGARTTNINVFNNNKNLIFSIPISHDGKELTENIKKRIIKGIKETVKYYEDNYQKRISEIYLVGGASLLPGLESYISEQTSKRVLLGNPLKKIIPTKYLDKKESILFANVIGLALGAGEGINLLSQPKGAEEGYYDKTSFFELAGKKKAFLSGFIITALIFIFLSSYFLFFKSSQDNNELIVAIPTSQPDAGPPLAETPTSTPELIKKIKVISTPTGWLNVRKGPGTSFDQIVRIYPGEKYKFLDEKDDWYKIELKDGKEGWISSEYAEIIEE
ncbi:MAG: pilus assembly protein PilM [bacterium]